jgi:lipopolysaccharide export LptBFGC system permease protein LptF
VILQRYILRELVVSFILAFLAVTAVCLVGMMFQVFRNFAGLGLGVLVRMLPLTIGYVAPWALLVASATATTLVYGRLGAENEIDAMRMNGVHAGRFLAPAVLFGLLLSLGGWGIIEHANPAARYERKASIKESTLLLLRALPRGNKTFEIGRFELSYTDCADNRMERPSLLRYEGSKQDRRLAMEYYAPEGRVAFEGAVPRVILVKPRYTQHDPDGTVHHLRAESDLSIPVEIQDLAPPEKNQDEKGVEELWEDATWAARGHIRNRALTTIHARYAQALAPLLLVLVSVPIGTFVRRGSRLAGLGASLPALLVYIVAFFLFKGMGDKGRLAPALAGWAADAVVGAAAAVLLGRMYRR